MTKEALQESLRDALDYERTLTQRIEEATTKRDWNATKIKSLQERLATHA